MDNRVDIIIEDVRQLRADTAEIREILARNTEILDRNTRDVEKHIKRTELLEEAMETALLPIKASKLFGQLIIGLGAVYGALKALGVI